MAALCHQLQDMAASISLYVAGTVFATQLCVSVAGTCHQRQYLCVSVSLCVISFSVCCRKSFRDSTVCLFVVMCRAVPRNVSPSTRWQYLVQVQHLWRRMVPCCCGSPSEKSGGRVSEPSVLHLTLSSISSTYGCALNVHTQCTHTHSAACTAQRP